MKGIIANKRKMFKFVNIYNIYTRNPKVMISKSPLTKVREKDEVIESVSDDIQKSNGEIWYKINGNWYADSMLAVEVIRKKYTLDGEFICATTCKR